TAIYGNNFVWNLHVAGLLFIYRPLPCARPTLAIEPRIRVGMSIDCCAAVIPLLRETDIRIEASIDSGKRKVPARALQWSICFSRRLIWRVRRRAIDEMAIT